VRGIRARGKTVFLTTHLMEEAERLCDRVAIIDHGRIVDIDTPARLVATHCPERTIEVATADPAAEAHFRRIASVDAVERHDERYIIRGRGEDLVTDVIQSLSEHRIRATDFRTLLPTLEDVFLTVTGHSIRD
jgi:ABC-2 type transport system ATP-binding protein